MFLSRSLIFSQDLKISPELRKLALGACEGLQKYLKSESNPDGTHFLHSILSSPSLPWGFSK